MPRTATIRELERAQREADEFLLDTSGNVVSDLRQLYVNYLNRFERAFTRGDFTSRDRFELQEASRVMSQLEDILIDSGLPSVLGGYRAQFPQVAEQALSYFELFDEPIAIRSIDDDVLDTLVRVYTGELALGIEDHLVHRVRTSLANGIVGDIPRQEAIDAILAQVEDLPIHQVETLVEDTYQRFHRTVRDEKGQELEYRWRQYNGPFDSVTRPACRFMLTEARHGVPGLWLAEELTAAIHPDLEVSPLIAGGGWNCRHNWSPVNDAYAEAQGARI